MVSFPLNLESGRFANGVQLLDSLAQLQFHYLLISYELFALRQSAEQPRGSFIKQMKYLLRQMTSVAVL